MNVKILEHTDRSIRFIIEGASLAFVNAIRRISIAEVPSMAVDYVYFIENNSPLYDEIIAHRIGLIPLTSDKALEKYAPPEVCKENEERPNCYARLYLEVEATSTSKIIYSGSMVSDDKDVKPVYDNIPIVVLGPGQKLAFEARARLGRGKEHAKWSPVSVATHKYMPKIVIDYTKCKAPECMKCVNVCPKKVLKLEDNRIKIVNEMECNLCRQCVRVCPEGAIKVSWKPNTYIMYIESTGVLKPERIVLEAAKILRGKAETLLRELEKLEGRTEQ